MTMIDPLVLGYVPNDQQRLLLDGEKLVLDCQKHEMGELSDYSYLVFPFAKVYEGFLKQLFRDVGAITEKEYQSDHFRIGKSLSPNMARLLGARSAFTWINRHYGNDLAMTLWQTWKSGRNLTFHYFPHNIRRLGYEEAVGTISNITGTMKKALEVTGTR